MYKLPIQSALLSLFFFFSSCNENLPIYTEPKDFLRGTIRHIGLPDVQYAHVDVNDISKAHISIYSPAQIFFIDIVNTFDETIQDQPEISGTMELVCDANSTARVTLTVAQANLSSTHYNTATKLLTLDPGDTLTLRCTWRYKTDDNIWGFQKANVLNEVSDPSGTFFTRTHAPLSYRASAKVKLFRSVGMVSVKEIEFTVLYSGKIFPPP